MAGTNAQKTDNGDGNRPKALPIETGRGKDNRQKPDNPNNNLLQTMPMVASRGRDKCQTKWESKRFV